METGEVKCMDSEGIRKGKKFYLIMKEKKRGEQVKQGTSEN